jgi:hypothetical protein
VMDELGLAIDTNVDIFDDSESKDVWSQYLW